MSVFWVVAVGALVFGVLVAAVGVRQVRKAITEVAAGTRQLAALRADARALGDDVTALRERLEVTRAAAGARRGEG